MAKILIVLMLSLFLMACSKPMNPALLLPDRCVTGVGLFCQEHAIGADGTVSMTIVNARGQTISDISFATTLCTAAEDNPTSMDNGETKVFKLTSCQLEPG